MSGINILFSHHVGAMTEGQMQLSELIGDSPRWDIDMDRPSGQLSVGQEEFDIQLIGSESYISNTWLWAWANSSSLPASLLQLSFRMHMHGAEHSADDLTEPEHPLDSFDGHTASVAITGTVGMHAYYRCHYEGGALFVAIHDPRLVSSAPAQVRFATYLPLALQTYEVTNHYLAAVGYAEHLGFEAIDDGDELQLVDANGAEQMRVTFDDQLRLANIHGRIAA